MKRTHKHLALASRRRLRGLSLAELIAVVALIALFAGVAAVAFRSSVEHARLKLATQRLVSDLRRTRADAQAAQEDRVITLYASPPRYFTSDVPGPTSAPSISLDLDRPPYHVDKLILTEPGALAITFSHDGAADFSGNIILQVGRRTAAITVEESGEILEPE